MPHFFLSVPIEKPVPYTIEKKVPYPIIIPVKKPQVHHHDYRTHHDTHSHHHLYDHHTDFTNNKYQQVSAHRPQSSEQSSSSASGSSSSASSSAENQEFLPRPEHHLRESTSSHQENTKLFSPYQQHSEQPYQQQHQLHHQQQYAQLRRDLLTRERMRSSSEESEADSTEFRPMMSSQSAEYMSPSSNVETVVPPPPPNQQTRTPFHINVPNVPNEDEPEKEATSHHTHSEQFNKFTHNIEIPVHFYRLQPLENGEGFAITS